MNRLGQHSIRFAAALAMCCRLQAGVVAGKVLELNSDQPVPQARVVVSSLGKETGLSVQTNHRGDFRLSAPGPGRYRVDVSKPGYAKSRCIVMSGSDSDVDVVVRIAKNGSLQGIIATDAGDPVLGASVSAIPARSGLRLPAEQTDDRGQFELAELEPGDYMLAAAHSGAGTTAGANAVLARESGSAEPRIVRIGSGEDYRGLRFTIPAGESRNIGGRIDQIPSGGRVLLTLVPHEHPSLAVAQTVADGEGRFRFDQIHPGHYDILAIGPSDPSINRGLGGALTDDPVFGRSEVTLTTQDEDTVSISMRPGRKVAFRLALAADDAPCPKGATLRLEGSEEWTARVDKTTQVRVEAPTQVPYLAPGRYRAVISGLPPGCFYNGESFLDLRTHTSDTITLKLGRGARVIGRIQFSNTEAPPQYVVVLAPDVHDHDDPFLWICNTDGRGRFEMEALRPGTYRIRVVPLAAWAGPEWKDRIEDWTTLQLDQGETEVELGSGV